LNDPCAAALRLFVKLLQPLVFFFSVLTRSLFKTQIRCVRQLFTDLPHFSLKKPVADEWLRVRDALLLTR